MKIIIEVSAPILKRASSSLSRPFGLFCLGLILVLGVASAGDCVTTKPKVATANVQSGKDVVIKSPIVASKPTGESNPKIAQPEVKKNPPPGEIEKNEPVSIEQIARDSAKSAKIETDKQTLDRMARSRTEASLKAKLEEEVANKELKPEIVAHSAMLLANMANPYPHDQNEIDQLRGRMVDIEENPRSHSDCLEWDRLQAQFKLWMHRSHKPWPKFKKLCALYKENFDNSMKTIDKINKLILQKETNLIDTLSAINLELEKLQESAKLDSAIKAEPNWLKLNENSLKPVLAPLEALASRMGTTVNPGPEVKANVAKPATSPETKAKLLSLDQNIREILLQANNTLDAKQRDILSQLYNEMRSVLNTQWFDNPAESSLLYAFQGTLHGALDLMRHK